MSLYDYVETMESHGYVTRFTDPDTGAYVELRLDEDASCPIDNYTDGIHLAYRERDRYNGPDEAIPTDMLVDCTHCNGTGEDDTRANLYRGYKIVGVGSHEAMDHEAERDPELHVDPAECPVCKGDGELDLTRDFTSIRDEAEAIGEYVRRTRDALGWYVFDTGNHGEATAVLYVTDADWTDPQAVAEAWAREYESWAEGDVYGIVSGDATGEHDDACWGFIGRQNAEDAALTEYLLPAIEDVKARREANIIKGCN